MDDGPRFTRRQTFAAVAAAAIARSAHATETVAATSEAVPAPATDQAHGVVFDGTGTDAKRRDDAAGIPDVMVSNGREIVRTDAAGRWSLPVRDGDAIFVIKPTGWMTPVDPHTQLPRFSYIHQPQGSPDPQGRRFRGVDPTGPLPLSIDFPLLRQAEPDKFDVLLFTDPQPESEAELGFVRDDVVTQAGRHGAAFGITTGDIMFDDLSLYGRSNRIVGTLGKPWYCCPGNHDMNLDATDDAFSRETYKRIFGARYFAFQYGGATFVMLDNVEYLGDGKYRGRIGPAQLGFVRTLLSMVPQEQLVVVCMHIPLHTLVGEEANLITTDGLDLLTMLAQRPNTVSFSGHTHTNEHHYLGPAGHHHHVLSAVSGSWWSGPYDVRGIPAAVASDGTPNGFHILSVDGPRFTTRLVPVHEAGSASMRIMVDRLFHADTPEVQHEYRMGQLFGGTLPADSAGSARLLVNLFDGGPRSNVAFALGEAGTLVPMQRVERIDPYVQEVYARNGETKKPWVQAGKSSHLWQARLPPDLAPGTHRVQVKATDEFGRAHDGAILLEIVGA